MKKVLNWEVRGVHGEGKRWVSRQGNYVRGRVDRAQNELGHVEL